MFGGLQLFYNSFGGVLGSSVEMQACGIGSTDLNQDMFRLVPVNLSGGEMYGLPFLYRRLLLHVSGTVH